MLLLAGCDAGSPAGPISPPPPNAEIVDGAHNDGQPGFLFVAPIVANADLSGQTAIAGLSPRVEICVLNTSTGTCDGLFRTFSESEITFLTNYYQVNWDSDEAPAVSSGTVYRVKVLIGSLELGHADVQFYDNGSAKNTTTADAIVLQNGRTLPIKFFIGTNFYDSTCGSGNDCYVGPAYSGQDNLIVTRDGDALLYIPDGALPAGGPYTVTIEERGDADCDFAFPADLPDGATLPDYNACYEYHVDPDPGTFGVPVIVGQCLNVSEVPAGKEHEVQLGAHHDDGRYELLPNTGLPAALSCDDYSPPTSSTLGFLRGAVRDVRDFIFGAPVYAGHLGLGGSVRDLSTIKWVDPGLRVAGFGLARGGWSSPMDEHLAAAMDALQQEYGYVWRNTANSLDDPGFFDGDVDVVLLGSVKDGANIPVTALSAPEQDSLHAFVQSGGCAVLLADNGSFGSANNSLVGPFGLATTGTLSSQKTATLTAAGAGFYSGTSGAVQFYPGWFSQTGAGTVFANNSGGPAIVHVTGDQSGAYAGNVFAFSDVNMFMSADNWSGGYFSSNADLLLQTVAGCGTEPAPAPPVQ